MQPNKFKRFYKLKKIENTYEDDCQIFYPTEWDEKYLAYKYYRQQCIHEILRSSYLYDFCHNWNYDSIFDTPNPDVPMPLYSLDNAVQKYHSEIEDFQIYHNHLELIQAFDNNQLEFIHTFEDNQFEDIQTYYNDNFEDVDQEDFQSIDLDYQFMENNFDATQYRPSETFDENDLSHEFRRHRPRKLTLGRFLPNKSPSRINVVKHRKAKRIRSIQIECVNKGSYNNSGTIVHSTVQIEEITSTNTSCCHLSEVRIISQTSNEKVHLNRIEIDKICKKDVKTHKTFSQAVSWGSSKFSSSNRTICNESVDRILIDNPWVQIQDFKSSKTFSETVAFGLTKTISKEQTVNIEAKTLKIDHPSVYRRTEEVIPSNSFQNLTTTWSKIVQDEEHTTSLVRSKTMRNEMDSNAETKSPKPRKVKFNKKRKCDFVQLDKLGTLLDIIVEPERNKEPAVLSYTNLLRRRQPEFICYRTVESKILIPTETESKYRSYKHAVVGVEKPSILADISPSKQKNESTKIEINDHLMTLNFAPKRKVCPKQKEKWILKESRRKRSNKTKNNQ